MMRPRRNQNGSRPDVEKARADLERIRGQRERVDQLVADLMREKRLNGFTANVIIQLRGGRS